MLKTNIKKRLINIIKQKGDKFKTQISTNFPFKPSAQKLQKIPKFNFSNNIEIHSNKINSEIQSYDRRGKNRIQYNLKENEIISGFKINKINYFKEFQITAFYLTHEKTGAKYYHLDSEDLDNCFSINFKTPAFDNTGIFHILEHLSHSGSKKYPIRDVFKNMSNRSFYSDINAFTGCDNTMFIFSTENKKDFKNLFDIFIDSAFNPNLDYLDFLQEGWRYEFIEDNSENKKGNELIIKGFIFNEMKGQMGRQENFFLQKIRSNLFVKSTYNYNSGGDPKEIHKLKYEDLIKAHKKYYHPSNTKFISYGDLDFTENLKNLNENLLEKYEKNTDDILIEDSIRIEKEREIIDYYIPELLGDSEGTSKFSISFLCQNINENLYETFKMSILSCLLLDSPKSPLVKKIIETGLAPNFCNPVGFDSSIKEGTFTIGVENIPTDYKLFKKIENEIYDSLKEIVEKGFEESFIEEILDVVEFHTKKPANDFAVNLFTQSNSFITHSDDPFAMLRINEFSEKLRSEIKSNKKTFSDLIRKNLLENFHRLKLILKPKADMFSQINKEELDFLQKQEKNLKPEDINKIKEDSRNLLDHQNKIQDYNCLPSISVEDIARFSEKILSYKEKLLFDIDLTFNDQPTNGIFFLRIKCDIKNLPVEYKEIIHLYAKILPELGTLETDYREFQEKIKSNEINIYIDNNNYHNPKAENIEGESEAAQEFFILEYIFQENKIIKNLKILEELLTKPNFADFSHLQQIIKQKSVEIANEINSNSLDYAMDFAATGFFEHRENYSKYKSDLKICKLGGDLIKTASPKEILNQLCDDLYIIHCLIWRKNSISICINGQKKYLETVKNSCDYLINAIKNSNEIFVKEINKENNKKNFEKKYYQTLIKTSSRVNDCVEVFEIPNLLEKEKDFAACLILGNICSNKFLQREIRDFGGAYSAGVLTKEEGICTFFSYRDPDPINTYLIYEKSVVKISEGKFEERDIDDAKILAFRVIDKKINAGDKGLVYFLRENITEEKRNELRRIILNLQKEDIVNVAKNYFIPQLIENKTNRVIFGGIEAFMTGKKDNFNANDYNNFVDDWEILDSFEFLSDSYFKGEDEFLEENFIKI